MSDRQPETLSEDDRDERIGEILNEFLDRRSRGEAVSEDELLRRNPEIADELRMHLDLLGDIQPRGDVIGTLIRQGLLSACADPHFAAELGAYKITGLIGRGGMGIVLKAHEQSLNRSVALKILRPELSGDPAVVRRFEREAKAAAALRHPNIVTVYAVGCERGVHFIAMEYVDGPSLATVIREPSALSRKPDVAADPRVGRGHRHDAGATYLPADIIRPIFRQLLSALAAAHDAGLIHRDVKSSNILLEGIKGSRDQGIEDLGVDGATPQSSILVPQSSFVKLADFGLARLRSVESTLTRSDSVLGTPDYMSPEQACGDRDIDHRSDLYSAGVVLYEMLTGHTPFRSDTSTATIHRILHEEPRHPRRLDKQVDPVLASLALRLMAKRREDRVLSATDGIQAMDAKTSIRSPERRRRIRHKMAFGLLGLAAVAAGSWMLSRLAGWSDSNSAVFAAAPRIAHAWVADRADPDYEQLKRCVQVRYGDDPTARIFHDFPAPVQFVRHVELVDLDGAGKQAVIVGLDAPLDGCNLWAFDARDVELWRLDVSDDPRIDAWPDCGPSMHWPCSVLRIENLDGRPGHEVVVVANDTGYYPTRISLIDPRAGKIISTFWHTGQIHRVWIRPDFIGPGHPGVVFRGVNNKLAGFDEPKPGDGEPYTDGTSGSLVDVLGVLDPARMDGLGPPRIDPSRLPFKHVIPCAYAFLDGPQAVERALGLSDARTETTPASLLGALCINDVAVLPAGAGDAEPVVRVSVGRAGESGRRGGGWILELGRNLELQHVTVVDGEEVDPTQYYPNYWQARWRPIVQNGAYLAR